LGFTRAALMRCGPTMLRTCNCLSFRPA
jgi:hypothetical protein